MFTDSLISSDIGDLKKDNLVGRYPSEGKETKNNIVDDTVEYHHVILSLSQFKTLYSSL